LLGAGKNLEICGHCALSGNNKYYHNMELNWNCVVISQHCAPR